MMLYTWLEELRYEERKYVFVRSIGNRTGIINVFQCHSLQDIL